MPACDVTGQRVALAAATEVLRTAEQLRGKFAKRNPAYFDR
jgi:hypothetical protein